MGIDRIGKGGAPPAAPETQGSGSVEKKGSIEKAFSVERPDATKQAWQAGAAEAAQGSQALARLEGLSPAELEDIKKVLRDQMSTDPGLVDLVRTATGQTPKIPED